MTIEIYDQAQKLLSKIRGYERALNELEKPNYDDNSYYIPSDAMPIVKNTISSQLSLLREEFKGLK